jgi:hypothetical protein
MDRPPNKPPMRPERPSQPDNDNRVIPFRPRGDSRWRWAGRPPKPPETPVDDLAKYERGEHTDDYKHRMQMNLLALGVTVVLIVAGVWIAETIAEMRKQQDCYLAGRRNCAPIDVPPTQRN